MARQAFVITPELQTTVDQPQEQLWIRQAQQGDHAAFAALVGRYWTRIYRWLLGQAGNAHVAEDLTQDVFLKAWAKLATFQAGTHFRAWLFCLARNCFLDSKRGPRGAAPLALPATAPAVGPDPVATLLGQETQTLVAAALERLPVQFRAPFLLRMQEELSFLDIARILGLTEQTARWRVFKARRLLVKELGPVLDRDG
jgi:RNA polymerase sigma-70 factor (ECF subfamily)